MLRITLLPQALLGALNLLILLLDLIQPLLDRHSLASV